MVTLKEKVFSRITEDFHVLAPEVFRQLELIGKMMDNNQDEELFNEICKNEHIIDSLEVKMRAEVINSIVLYAPRATNLRIIISYYDMTANLERVGDMIVNLSNSLKKTDIKGALFGTYKNILQKMLDLVCQMTNKAIDAFIKGEIQLAKEVIDLDDEVDELYYQIVRGIPSNEADKNLSASELTDLLAINSMAYNIERIGDHATNIAESAVYLIQGENMKHLGHENDALSLINDKD